jgi:hypothetical protein
LLESWWGGRFVVIFVEVYVVLDLRTAKEASLLVNGCVLLCCWCLRQYQACLRSSKTDSDKGLCFGGCNGSNLGTFIF